ncbi:MAG: helix-turn-helix transcriptional regulator [Myxococcota bacterium]
MTLTKMVGADTYRLTLEDGHEALGGNEPTGPPLRLPLRCGRQSLGTLELFFDDAGHGEGEARLARWGARIFARGISYAQRLAADGRRAGEGVEETLARTPLTPRERDVVSLLVSGQSTRNIAARTGLTVATVNTYLKRIFSKLGVHSRVELVAKVAGTAPVEA